MSELTNYGSFASSSSVEEYDSEKLSRQQIETGKAILANFVNTIIRWQVLMAQMQSGKTETFLFVAAEMIRLGLVKNIVIFSGNAETDLRHQLSKEVEDGPDAKFYDKYDAYLEEDEEITTSAIRKQIKRNIKKNIQIVWGTQLKNYSGPSENTLFIWEESHHAQSLKQCPDKFLRKIGVSADGDETILGEKNNYVVSVSATPFSEVCDKVNLDQSKAVVSMKPGLNYNSVEKMKANGRIKFYSNIAVALQTALRKEHVGNKYAVIRIGPKNEEAVKKIISDNGWTYCIFDSVSDDPLGKQTWDNMCHEPTRDTAILLRNKCRMGKNLEKEHVLFCFETAKKSRTDTVLQGLLGRVCGYSANSENIDVYLSDKIQKTGELERYIQLVSGCDIVPRKAANIKGAGVISNREPVVIMKMDRSQVTDRARMADDIKAAFNANLIENQNSPRAKAVIQSVINHPDTHFVMRRLEKKNETYMEQNIPEKIANSLADGTPFHGVNGCGFNSADPLQVIMWLVVDVDGLRRGDVYIDCFVPLSTEIPARDIPMTTGREVFAHKLEDERNVVSNGSFQIYLNPETANSVPAMLDDLKEIIGMYMTCKLNTSNSVCSNQDEETGDKVGIYVTLEVLASLEKNGLIYETIHQELGFKLKICKARGAVPKAIKDRGMMRLASISW
jgi:hypothetical protein